MVIIKSYTDIEQSRKLAEILPIESADMYYISGDECDICFGRGVYEEIADWICEGRPKSADIPCWSLAALLGVLPKIINNKKLFIESSTELWHIGYRNNYIASASNIVDACYEMIIHLHELNLL